MDAARISDVRENVKADGWLTAAEALDLLDALDQARKERDVDTILRCASVARRYAQNVDNEYFRNEIAGNTCLAIAELITDLAHSDEVDGCTRDKLDQARADADSSAQSCENYHRLNIQITAQRDAAQKDAKDTRELLVEAHELLGVPVNKELRDSGRALRARIEVMLEQKP